jgi:hypothetical protein
MNIIEKYNDFVLCEKNICSYCYELSNEPGVVLQCGHTLHHKCINKMIFDKFGNDLYVIEINKENIYQNLEKNEIYNFNKMTFGTRKSNGILDCPHKECQEIYSILSPIFKDFNIPKRIDNIVLLEYENDDGKKEKVMHHLCTNIDLIHMLSRDHQIKLLINFDYARENNCFDGMNSHEIVQICLLENSDDFIFHGVMFNDTFVIFPKSKCPACFPESNVDEKNIIYKHASIDDFIVFITTGDFFDNKENNYIETQ